MPTRRVRRPPAETGQVDQFGRLVFLQLCGHTTVKRRTPCWYGFGRHNNQLGGRVVDSEDVDVSESVKQLAPPRALPCRRPPGFAPLLPPGLNSRLERDQPSRDGAGLLLLPKLNDLNAVDFVRADLGPRVLRLSGNRQLVALGIRNEGDRNVGAFAGQANRQITPNTRTLQRTYSASPK